jgi:hypothetical protein
MSLTTYVLGFLGWARIGIKSRHFPKGTWVDESEVGHCADKGMRFHLDWNWIMQVIDKMEER